MTLVNELSAVPLTVTEPSQALTPRKSPSLWAVAGRQKQKTARNVALRSIILNISWRYSALVSDKKQDKYASRPENTKNCWYCRQFRFLETLIADSLAHEKRKVAAPVHNRDTLNPESSRKSRLDKGVSHEDPLSDSLDSCRMLRGRIGAWPEPGTGAGTTAADGRDGGTVYRVLRVGLRRATHRRAAPGAAQIRL